MYLNFNDLVAASVSKRILENWWAIRWISCSIFAWKRHHARI